MNGSGREGNDRGKSSGRREGETDHRRGASRSSPAPGELTGRPEGGQQAKGKQGSPRPPKGREGQFRLPGRPGKPPCGPGQETGRKPESPGQSFSPSGSGPGRAGFSPKGSDRVRGPLFQDNRRHEKKFSLFERPKWTAPALSTEPIAHPDCPYCGKPIRDMFTAIADRDSGEPVHFECAAARIAEGETLEKGDAVTYLGGGRFGVVHFPGMIRDALRGGRKGGDEYDTKNFRIKKIVEWENKEDRSPWRKNIGDHFSVV